MRIHHRNMLRTVATPLLALGLVLAGSASAQSLAQNVKQDIRTVASNVKQDVRDVAHGNIRGAHERHKRVLRGTHQRHRNAVSSAHQRHMTAAQCLVRHGRTNCTQRGYRYGYHRRG